MKSPSPKCYMTFWDMTIYNDTLNWSDIHLFANLLPNWTLLTILTLLPNFGGFHRALQRVRLSNRGRLLLRTPGPVTLFSNVETTLSWTCHVYRPFEFRTSLGTSILLWTFTNSDFPNDQSFQQCHTLILRLTFTELWVVFMEHLQRVSHASREHLPYQTPGSIPLLGNCLCSNCWYQIPRTCHVLTRFFTLNTPWYNLDFAFLHLSLDVWI